MSLIKKRFATGMALPCCCAPVEPGPCQVPSPVPCFCRCVGVGVAFEAFAMNRWVLGPGDPRWRVPVERGAQSPSRKGQVAPRGCPCKNPSWRARLPNAAQTHSQPILLSPQWDSGNNELQGCFKEDWGIPGWGKGAPFPPHSPTPTGMYLVSC